MQVARDVFALFVLHMDHAPHEPAIFFVEPLQRRRQRVDPFGDDDELRRAIGGNAHRMFAALETLQALRERRDRTQRSRHGERDEREGGDGDSRAADREPDDLLPNFGDLIRGIGSDHDRGPPAGFDSGHSGVRQHEPGEPLRRTVDVLPRVRLLSGERDANMAQPSRVGEKSRDLRLRVWRRVKSRQRRFDEFARKARRAVGFGANARARMQYEQADAERQSQRKHDAEQQRQAKAQGERSKHRPIL